MTFISMILIGDCFPWLARLDATGPELMRGRGGQVDENITEPLASRGFATIGPRLTCLHPDVGTGRILDRFELAVARLPRGDHATGILR